MWSKILLVFATEMGFLYLVLSYNACDYMKIYVSFECCPEESYVYPYSNIECLQNEHAYLHVMS